MKLLDWGIVKSILSAVSKIKPCMCNVYVSETANDLWNWQYATTTLIVSATWISTRVILELPYTRFVGGLEHAQGH